MRQQLCLGTALLLLVGCGQPSTLTPPPLPQTAHVTANQATAQQQREVIRATALPADHREQIDAAFARFLKDPDSRRIEVRRQPYGSLVCGSVNARNSYGGYTGPQPFVAYFGRDGRLAYNDLVTWETIKILQGQPPTWRAQTPSLGLAWLLWEDCGGS